MSRLLSALIPFCVPLIAVAQSPYWVYRSEPAPANCTYPNLAVNGVSPITETLADDATVLSGFAGQPVSVLGVSLYNYNSVPVAFRPRFRFWQANGPGGKPGGTLGSLGFTTDGTTIAAYLAQETLFSVEGSGMLVPAGRFWTGISFDNAMNRSDMATPGQLNSVGVMPGSPTTGDSDSDFFRGTVASDQYGVANPLGNLTSGNLAISMGIAGQDARIHVTLGNVIGPMSFARTISATTLYGAKLASFQGDAVTQDMIVTMPAVLPGGDPSTVQIRIGGQPFLHKTVSLQMPAAPNSNPVEVDLGNVLLVNGDVDGSGEIDLADIDEVIAAYGQAAEPDYMFLDLDVNGEIDLNDIDIVIQGYGLGDE